MKARIERYQKEGPDPVPIAGAAGGGAGPPILPAGIVGSQAGKREYSQLETSKIQAACGLTDTQWDTYLPKLYTRMLEEGRTTAQVKSLLEDIFCPDVIYLLSSVHLMITDEMAKDIKEVNFGFNNDLSYNTCHRGISPFTVIGVSMATASCR